MKNTLLYLPLIMHSILCISPLALAGVLPISCAYNRKKLSKPLDILRVEGERALLQYIWYSLCTQAEVNHGLDVSEKKLVFHCVESTVKVSSVSWRKN